MGLLAFGMVTHAYPKTASDEAIRRVATPDNISKDELIQKLIGTWQCTYRDDDVMYDAKLVFDKNGTLTSQKVSQLLTDPKGETAVYTHRDWQIVENSKMWLLVEKVNTTTLLDVPPAIDKKAQLKSYLDKNPIESSLMSFGTQDDKQTLTRIDGGWGLLLGECIKH